MGITVPTGLGIGANCETYEGRERIMWHQAVSRLGAQWAHSWSRLDVGPGPMAPMSQWLEFMPLAYALLDDPLVGGLAPFSAYPKTRDGVERHPGFMLPDGSLTALGQQYVAERRRRYGA